MNGFKKVLVPLDGSPAAGKALLVATTLAKALGSEVILLHVTDLPTPTLFGGGREAMLHQLEELRAQMHHEANRYLGDVQAELSDNQIANRALVRENHPARQILSIAAEEHVDLIVMCAHGKGAMLLHTLGGIADKVIRQSPCPVLLVQQTGESKAPDGAAA